MDELTKALQDVRRELATIRQSITQVLFYIREAESEIPEKMRRFVTYMHDVHDITIMYESRGLPIPPYIMREMERCDDRYRQLLKDSNSEGGHFAKIRAEMAKDKENRWDHTRRITSQGHYHKENGSETR
jgi:hypothetical protein